MANWFSDLTKNIFELKLKKEELQKEHKDKLLENELEIKLEEQVRFDKGEYHEQKMENKILLS